MPVRKITCYEPPSERDHRWLVAILSIEDDLSPLPDGMARTMSIQFYQRLDMQYQLEINWKEVEKPQSRSLEDLVAIVAKNIHLWSKRLYYGVHIVDGKLYFGSSQSNRTYRVDIFNDE